MPHTLSFLRLVVLGAALLSTAAAAGDDRPGPTQGPRSQALIEEADLEYGEEIWYTCAPCHGDVGQGGGAGVYPRLAGLPARYIAEQLLAFKRRDRINIPMYPYTTERELPNEDVVHVSAYAATRELLTTMPDPDKEMDGLARLKLAKRVLAIPREKGNVDTARAVYAKDCARCHGEDGYGHEDIPQVAGQHIPYMRKQFQMIQAGERPHEHAEELFGSWSEQDVQDMLALFSVMDD